MPYALCPMPYAHEYLIFLRKAIVNNFFSSPNRFAPESQLRVSELTRNCFRLVNKFLSFPRR